MNKQQLKPPNPNLLLQEHTFAPAKQDGKNKFFDSFEKPITIPISDLNELRAKKKQLRQMQEENNANFNNNNNNNIKINKDNSNAQLLGIDKKVNNTQQMRKQNPQERQMPKSESSNNNNEQIYFSQQIEDNGNQFNNLDDQNRNNDDDDDFNWVKQQQEKRKKSPNQFKKQGNGFDNDSNKLQQHKSNGFQIQDKGVVSKNNFLSASELPQIITASTASSNQFNKKNMAAIQLRSKFQQVLGKLIDLETRETAANQLKEIILANQSQDDLRVWISALGEYHSRHSKFSSWEQEVLLIGFIAAVYKDKLLDPADRPPSILKSCFKLCEMIQKYFQAKQCTEQVQKACGDSWCAIYFHCMRHQSISNKELILYATLKNIVTGGGDRAAQVTAVVVLDAFLQKLRECKENELIENISKSFIPQIYVRNGIESASTFRCCSHIVLALHIKNLMVYTSILIEKALAVLSDKSTHYKVKITGCEFLEIIGRQFQELSENIVGSYHDEVLTCLTENSKDRVLQVQSAAKQAITEWSKFKKKYENLEQFKLHKQKRQEQFDIDQLIQEKTSSKFKGAKAQNYNQDRPSSSYSKPFYQAENKPREFVKKKSGTGGGSVFSQNQDIKPRNASQRQETSKLKEYIMKQRENQNQGLADTILFDDSLNAVEEHQREESFSQVDDTLRYDSHYNDNEDYENEDDYDQLAETMDFNSSLKREPVRGILRNSEFQNKGKRVVDDSPSQKQLKQNDGQAQCLAWNNAIQLADSGEIEDAFKLVMEECDDLYLIRLMLRNKQQFTRLQQQTQLVIVSKLIQFMQTNFIMKLCLDFFQDGAESGIVPQMTEIEQAQIIEILKQFTELNSDIGLQAADVLEHYKYLVSQIDRE